MVFLMFFIWFLVDCLHLMNSPQVELIVASLQTFQTFFMLRKERNIL